jgi:hypothetical protein
MSASTAILPLPAAFVKHKPQRRRRCTVAKITYFTDDVQHERPVLAVAWRNQQGTRKKISIPVEVLRIAEQVGVQDIYLRRDKPVKWMRRISLREFQHRAFYNKHDDEKYIDIEAMQPVAWADWLFAEDEVELSTTSNDNKNSYQLRFDDLLGEAGEALQ